MDIKEIKVAELNTVSDVDSCLRETRMAITTIEGQLETATQAGQIAVEAMSPKKQGWFIGASGALRHAERIQEDLLDRREVLLIGSSSTLKELVTILETPPISITSAQAEKFARDIKGIIPKLESINEED